MATCPRCEFELVDYEDDCPIWDGEYVCQTCYDYFKGRDYELEADTEGPE